MARSDDIATAFRASIRIAPNGKRTVTTVDFVEYLAKVNHDFTLAEANQWIKTNTVTFRDASSQEGEAKTYRQFNPNGGI